MPPGGRLGIYGFGGSAHLAAQVALHEGAARPRDDPRRAQRAGNCAQSLGAGRHPGPTDPPPEPLDAAILFAPAGELVPVALSGARPGGTLAVAGIYLSDIPPLDYDRHLFQERRLRSVTANTRADGEEFLSLAARIPVQVATVAFSLDQAPEALRALANGEVRGAAVLHVE